jgi:hypothetical protein
VVRLSILGSILYLPYVKAATGLELDKTHQKLRELKHTRLQIYGIFGINSKSIDYIERRRMRLRRRKYL